MEKKNNKTRARMFWVFVVIFVALALSLGGCTKSLTGPTPPEVPNPNLRFAVKNIKYERIRTVIYPQFENVAISLIVVEINPANGITIPDAVFYQNNNVPRISDKIWLTEAGFPSLRPGTYQLYWIDRAVGSSSDGSVLVGKRSWIGTYELTTITPTDLGEAVRFQLMNDGIIR